MGVTSQLMSLLSDPEIEQRLAGVPDWRAGEQHTIVRDRQFANFADAMVFVNSVAEVAEIANHHPDILLHGWNKVRLTLSTHSQGADRRRLRARGPDRRPRIGEGLRCQLPTIALATFDASTSAMNDDEDLPEVASPRLAACAMAASVGAP